MKIGYARVSTKDQNLDLQMDALKKEGCSKIYSEIVSGKKSDRPQLQEMLANLRHKDIVVVWKLDRLGRSLKNLVELINKFIQKKVGFKSLQDPIDTTTSHGRLVFNMFASLAEFERDIICERTNAGLKAARARGRLGGRPKGIPAESEATACAAEALYREGKLSVMQIAKKLDIAKSTLYKYLRYRNVEIGQYEHKPCALATND